MRLYRLLQLLLLPPGFRREFGEEMAGDVGRRLTEAEGAPARSRVMIREWVDLVRTAGREWWAVARRLPGRETNDETGMWTMWNGLVRDVKYALRTLGRAPAFSLVVVVTLALGIGANTAIFSVVDAVLLESLPYDEPDRLVTVWQDVRERGGPEREWFNYEDFLDLRNEEGLLEAAGVWGGWRPTLTGVGEPEVVQGATVSHEMISDVLRVNPVMGRGFLPEDDVEGAPGRILISHRAWQERFQGDPDVVGRSVSLSEVPYTVVGVLPPGFQAPFVPDAEMWRALGPTSVHGCTRGCYGVRVVARLADGVTLEAARDRARALAARLEEAYPDTNTRKSFAVFGLQEDMTRNASQGLWVLLGAVGFVLLIACTNVANLLLARGSARRAELGVRTALGAGRGRIVRQLLTESLVLALAGGAVGLGLAVWGTDALLGMAPDGTVPRLDGVGVDGRVLAFTAAVTVATGVLFGLVPALRSTRRGVHGAIRSGDRRSSSGTGRLLGALVVAQVAMALVLLVGAGLLVRSFQRLSSAELGFDPEQVLALQITLPGTRYTDGAERRTFYYELLERVRALPGVDRVGATNALPLAGFDGDASFQVEGEPPPPPGVNQAAWVRPVTEGYFETIGLDLLAGRSFTASDDAEGDRVIIVNELLAERYFPDSDPVGKRLNFGDPEDPNWRTIVGVARDVRHFGIRNGTRPAVYFPFRQVSFATMYLTARVDGDPTALAGGIRSAIASLDPALAASQIRPLRALVDQALAPDRFVTGLLGVFAMLALVLAAVGIYGVVSYGVTRRMREMGIRLALGAEGGDVRRLVVRGAAGLTGLGVALGLAGSLGLTGVLESLLYDLEPTDPLTFGATAAILLGVALLASWIPARKAGRADPVSVLREE